MLITPEESTERPPSLRRHRAPIRQLIAVCVTLSVAIPRTHKRRAQQKSQHSVHGGTSGKISLTSLAVQPAPFTYPPITPRLYRGIFRLLGRWSRLRRPRIFRPLRPRGLTSFAWQRRHRETATWHVKRTSPMQIACEAARGAATPPSIKGGKKLREESPCVNLSLDSYSARRGRSVPPSLGEETISRSRRRACHDVPLNSRLPHSAVNFRVLCAHRDIFIRRLPLHPSPRHFAFRGSRAADVRTLFHQNEQPAACERRATARENGTFSGDRVARRGTFLANTACR